MMLPCCAFAYAIEPSDRTLAAIAALIGRARFAFTSDICSRSGNCSPDWASSSSLSSPSFDFLTLSAMRHLPGMVWLVVLDDGVGLLGVRIRDRVITQRVEGDGCVDRRRHVGVDQGHLLAVR